MYDASSVRRSLVQETAAHPEQARVFHWRRAKAWNIPARASLVDEIIASPLAARHLPLARTCSAATSLSTGPRPRPRPHKPESQSTRRDGFDGILRAPEATRPSPPPPPPSQREFGGTSPLARETVTSETAVRRRQPQAEHHAPCLPLMTSQRTLPTRSKKVCSGNRSIMSAARAYTFHQCSRAPDDHSTPTIPVSDAPWHKSSKPAPPASRRPFRHLRNDARARVEISPEGIPRERRRVTPAVVHSACGKMHSERREEAAPNAQ
ncbi:hypothetical protein B0H16DRAFT_1473613 [Mycena metata]|uniref:Uncharacterized protein n=1 Tax=Mycena metata TaxID=1033252 RepID=A0AAD7HKE6_9AGAR|nr:hypothetical protein B0H16DRAFT_1473613 [Mycena metata]